MDSDTDDGDDATFEDYSCKSFYLYMGVLGRVDFPRYSIGNDIIPRRIPDTCQNEVEGINTFYECITHRYNACPPFFIGSLREACESAFDSLVLTEHRPVLVYIHHENSPLNNTFCSKIFCSEEIIKYLSKNYIIWPWDITSDSNRNKLMKIWNQIFPTPLFSIYIIERCPMLIGIMRRSEKENSWSGSSNYEFQVLLEGNVLTRIQEELRRETFLKNLAMFKKECDENERALSFNFMSKTGLNWDIILEIAEYLSLNDSVTVFSPEILPYLLEYKSKLHLSEPSTEFIKMILQTINPQQIVSLSFKAVRSWPMIDLPSLAIFTEMLSLRLLDLYRLELINEYEKYFPKLNNLFLWYHNGVDVDVLCSIIGHLSRPIKRLKIRFTTVSCMGSCDDRLKIENKKNSTVEYFYLDITQFIFPSMYDCSNRSIVCFRNTLLHLIKSMKNIKYIRLNTNDSTIKNLLCTQRWKSLVRECHQLKKITLYVLGSKFQYKQLIQDALEIQETLCAIRETVKFQMNYL